MAKSKKSIFDRPSVETCNIPKAYLRGMIQQMHKELEEFHDAKEALQAQVEVIDDSISLVSERVKILEQICFYGYKPWEREDKPTKYGHSPADFDYEEAPLVDAPEPVQEAEGNNVINTPPPAGAPAAPGWAIQGTGGVGEAGGAGGQNNLHHITPGQAQIFFGLNNAIPGNVLTVDNGPGQVTQYLVV